MRTSIKWIPQCSDQTEKHFHLATLVDLEGGFPLLSGTCWTASEHHPSFSCNHVASMPCRALSSGCHIWLWCWVSRSGRWGRGLESWTDGLWRPENQHCLSKAGTTSISFAWSNFNLRITWGMSGIKKKACISTDPQFRQSQLKSPLKSKTDGSSCPLLQKGNSQNAPFLQDAPQNAALQGSFVILWEIPVQIISQLILSTQ